jgi:hypothetical protein
MDSVQSRTIEGPELPFHCLACDKGGQARSYQYGERVTLLHLVPLSPFTNTNYVQCRHCGETYVSPIPLSELPYLTTDELNRLLGRRVGLVPMFLAVVAFLFSPLPGIGLVLALISFFLNGFRPKHWTRLLSRIALAIASVCTVLMLALMALVAIFE